MLNKNRITGKVAMDDWRGTGMQITEMEKMLKLVKVPHKLMTLLQLTLVLIRFVYTIASKLAMAISSHSVSFASEIVSVNPTTYIRL